MKKFLKRGFMVYLFIFALTAVNLSYASEEYPNRPISLIIPATAGGVSDLVARTLAEFLSKSLGQSVVPVNKPGGGMLIGGNAVATSKPDGYTVGMLMIPTALPEIYRFFQEPPYSSADLKLICRIADFVGIIVVKSDAPWNNFKDVVEHVRKNPGMKFGITARGGSPHLIMLTIAKKENMVFIDLPHTGDADVVRDILGGHIPIGMVAYPSGRAQVNAGNLKVLAVYAEKKFKLLPQIPILIELGYIPGHYPCIGLFVSKNTPDIIVQKINEAVKKVNEDKSYLEKLENLGFLVNYESTDQYKDSLNRYKIDIENFLGELGYVKK